MKTAIVYVSTHHGNTKKLIDAIQENDSDITVIDGIGMGETIELSEFDRIGFASGIAYGKFYPQLIKIMEDRLPQGKKVFFIYSCGSKRAGYTNAVKKIAEGRNAEILGEYGCIGFDTFGPFKLLGGIGKGHPNEEEIKNAVLFYKSLN